MTTAFYLKTHFYNYHLQELGSFVFNYFQAGFDCFEDDFCQGTEVFRLLLALLFGLFCFPARQILPLCFRTTAALGRATVFPTVAFVAEIAGCFGFAFLLTHFFTYLSDGLTALISITGGSRALGPRSCFLYSHLRILSEFYFLLPRTVEILLRNNQIFCISSQ